MIVGKSVNDKKCSILVNFIKCK